MDSIMSEREKRQVVPRELLSKEFLCNFVHMRWNNLIYSLLFSGLGAFSYLFLVNNTDLTPRIADALYSRGAFIFFILVFNVLGYTTLRLSSWINTQYAVSVRSRWKISVIYMTVTLLYLLLNYGLLIFAKILAGTSNLFTVTNSGWRILVVVWLVELVILGLVVANRSMLNALKLQKKRRSFKQRMIWHDTQLYKINSTRIFYSIL